ncbi:polysaccharide deacetylase family protein [Spirosoma sp. HMF4905]|uniref:Polysaccharide deacetylase family protein n=1 Tax=Spirosoma arboris TaxID=2682092 RepID=A0A7K1SF40_9BACT|nr:polysaccharide deacetylase family protein [Spirosoma arboris]MVM32401.1 polysaccharide deacetylase family protein [Spirosoma arboris]
MRFFIGLLLFMASTAQAQKKIAITIDDLPTVSKVYRSPSGRLQLTQKLLSHCTTYRVPAIGFVISNSLLTNSQPDSNQIGLLKLWLTAGLELGNHTLAHKDYNLISFEESKADVIGGEQFVKNLVRQRGKPFRYFRHPYLRKGDTQAKKDSLEKFLQHLGYQEAPVTIDNSDWLFSSAYDNALLLGDTELAAKVGNQYVGYMLDCVAYYEAQSDSLFNRQISQILLIHANTINADFLGKLLVGLNKRGYTFVSLEKALTDEAYQSIDHYYGKGGISWMHRWALTRGKRGAFFKGEPEVPAMIDALANRVITLPCH